MLKMVSTKHSAEKMSFLKTKCGWILQQNKSQNCRSRKTPICLKNIGKNRRKF
jgi:hypothetical protein